MIGERGLTTCRYCRRQVSFDRAGGKVVRHRYDDPAAAARFRRRTCWGSGKNVRKVGVGGEISSRPQATPVEAPEPREQPCRRPDPVPDDIGRERGVMSGGAPTLGKHR
jgi:hypothetical protein